MATPTISSTVNFVKKYPITLCGFSLLFMPSVHRLLFYFTPLLLSTAVFIVAMLSLGPSMSSAAESRGKRRDRSNEWAFNGSLKIYGEEEEEEEEEEEGAEEVGEMAEAPQRKISEGILPQEDVSSTAKENKKQPAPQLTQEPDPDFDEESNLVGIASNAVSGGQAEPDPDFRENCVGAAFSVIRSRCQAEPDPDLSGDCVGTSSNVAITCGQAELDPDLHGEQQVEDQEFTAAKHLPGSNDDYCHTEPAPINPDQPAACDHHDYHDAEPDHHLHAAIAELREQLGVMKRLPYTADARDRHSQHFPEHLQALQATA